MSSEARVVTHRNRAGELANLGSRLVRLGQMLQDDQTKIGELMRLAQECRFNLNLHVATDSDGRGDD
ncbi:hypothetical protein HBR94_10620 [Pseudomonas sp. WS 5412]|uniref:hypothetical protein n=1 Tax=unclassified Pseudomonas TaxID=196821 RepID=UPI001474BCF5|nr:MULTISPECIES: hypothetical protein [unclassified Pseudomonas]MBJ2241239.1 hypothetical protein [Pseudomonas sp. MF6768]MBJ2263690.1 hypothetical protein [Pseudomonas sp. MF6787]NMY31952.1 hypothetical protein [Pseudomonas sp. WS 5412]